MLLLTQMFHNFLHMAQPKKAFSPSIFGKDATAGVRETRLSSFYIIPMVMIGVGVAGVYVCVRARMCVCVCIVTRFSTQPCQLHFICCSFLSHGIWEYSVHPRFVVFAGITHYQKPLQKGFEYLQKK